MPLIRVPTHIVEYQTVGSNRSTSLFPLLFVPGLGCTWEVWRSSIDFHSRHRRVIAVNPRGAGRSVNFNSSFTFADMAHDLVKVLDREKLDRVVLVGLSMGGGLSLQATVLYPDRFAGIITYGATTPGFPTGDTSLDEWKAFTLCQLGSAFDTKKTSVKAIAKIRMAEASNNQKVIEYLIENISRTDFKDYIAQMRAASSATAANSLSQIGCKVAVLQGAQDRTVWPIVGRWIARQIPLSIYIELKDGLHFGNLDNTNLFDDAFSKALKFVDSAN